ncbi:MAG: 4-hydroxy-tetrahydrodipicolinate synthase [Anaerotignaceae bacterium]
MSLFTGSAVAIVTPFNDDYTINYEAFKELIEFQIKNGTDAIIVAGTTGEVSALTDEDQFKLIKFAVDIVNKRVPVIGGAGSNVTSHAIKLAKGAQAQGADGLLVVTPYYNKTTQKGLIAHYKAINDSVDIPIILYSVASRTGVNIAPATVLELSKMKNIVAIKEASGDLSQVARIAELCGPDFDIYSGNDDQTLPIMAVGGKGVISVLANIMPKETHDICDMFFKGDIEGSRKLFLETLTIANTLFIEVNPVPVKVAVNLMGYNAGPTIPPLCGMEDENLEKLKNVMKGHKLI